MSGKVNEAVLEKTAQRCREKNIILPTYKQMRDPSLVPEGIRAELAELGLWDLHPRNLFRITWRNAWTRRGPFSPCRTSTQSVRAV